MTTHEKFSASQVASALREAHGIKAAAARALGCERETIDAYIRRHPTVKAAHDEATDHVLDIAESHLIRAVERGEWDQIRYYLNAKGRSRGYGERAVQTNYYNIDVTKLTDEQLDALIATQSPSRD